MPSLEDTKGHLSQHSKYKRDNREKGRGEPRPWERERVSRRIEEKKDRRVFGEHQLHLTLCIKPFVLLWIRCPHSTLLLVMIGLDRMAVGMDVTWQLEWKIRGTLRGRMVLPGVQHWKLVES